MAYPAYFPCSKDCKDRCIGCHATCEGYIKARKKLDEKNEMIRKAKNEYKNSAPIKVNSRRMTRFS